MPRKVLGIKNQERPLRTAAPVHSRAIENKAITVTIKEVSVDETGQAQSPEQGTLPNTAATEPKIKADTPVQEEIQEPVEEVEGITLFSVVNSLQTGLLANLISTNTNIPCAVETNYTKRLSHVSLTIVDCQGRSFDDLQSLVRSIQSHKTELRVVLLNAEAESEHEELLDWPCIVGVFFDDTDQEQLIRGLNCMLNGEYWVPRRLLHHFLQKNRRAPSSRKTEIKLTKRERQILKLIKNGATNSDIAKVLEVSEHTVKSHLYNVYKKIGVRNRLEANNWVRDMDNI